MRDRPTVRARSKTCWRVDSSEAQTISVRGTMISAAVMLLNSKMVWSISFSCSFIEPSSSATSTIALNSSVVNLSSTGMLPPGTKRIKELVTNLSTTRRGKINFEKSFMGYATSLEIGSALCTATVFGVISPNMSSNTVVIPTAIPTPLFPKRAVVKDATRLADATFTNMLPTSMVINSRRGLSRRPATITPLLP